MCTVTYIPQSEGFIFSSNRDVSASRSPDRVLQVESNGQKMIYPRDTVGGTWIAMNQHGYFACILNGAFSPHTRRDQYRKSRGLILLDFFNYSSSSDFFQACDLDGIEPFTIVIWDGQLAEMRWDGSEKYVQLKDSRKAHIWASCTLYSPLQQSKRMDWLTSMLEKSGATRIEQIRKFHREAGEGDIENNMIMDRRPQVQTVSITHITVNNKVIQMDYEDLITGSKDTGEFAL